MTKKRLIQVALAVCGLCLFSAVFAGICTITVKNKGVAGGRHFTADCVAGTDMTITGESCGGNDIYYDL